MGIVEAWMQVPGCAMSMIEGALIRVSPAGDVEPDAVPPALRDGLPGGADGAPKWSPPRLRLRRQPPGLFMSLCPSATDG